MQVIYIQDIRASTALGRTWLFTGRDALRVLSPSQRHFIGTGLHVALYQPRCSLPVGLRLDNNSALSSGAADEYEPSAGSGTCTIMFINEQATLVKLYISCRAWKQQRITANFCIAQLSVHQSKKLTGGRSRTKDCTDSYERRQAPFVLSPSLSSISLSFFSSLSVCLSHSFVLLSLLAS